MNNLQINFLKIISLSTYILPNLANITLPFVLIFGLILTFIKLDKDKEIITIYSLGLSIKQVTKPLFLTSIIFTILYLFLNLFMSPLIYDLYKKKEFELRNIVNLKNINYSNFLELNDGLIVDFEKDGKFFKDIFISYKDKAGDNIIYANKGIIDNKSDNIIFNLYKGNKINIKNNEIENLEFENYKITFPNKNKKEYNNFDKNTDTIFELIEKRDLKNISEKIFDTFILITILFFFYNFLIKKNNFDFLTIMKYLTICVTVLIFQNGIKNLQLSLNAITTLNLLNLSIIYIFVLFNEIKNR